MSLKEWILPPKQKDVTVLMVGGRYTGKRSLVSLMETSCEVLFTGIEPRLSLAHDGDSGVRLAIGRKTLENYFNLPYRKQLCFMPDRAPMGWATRVFHFSFFQGKRLLNDLHFWLTDRDLVWNHKICEDMLQKVDPIDVLLISVSTPHLVEEVDPEKGYGRYHDLHNMSDAITDFVKHCIQRTEKPMMVLFVPLKCEKYYNHKEDPARGMPMVNKMLRLGYRDLLEFLESEDICRRCTTVISPALTIGGTEFKMFDDYGWDIYDYVEDPDRQCFSPRYCEQPMLLSQLYGLLLSKQEWFGKRHLLWRWPQQMQQLEQMLRKLITVQDIYGREILSDPLGMFQ